ncbi:MAG TPA: hypothetical protein PKI80_13050 [Deltaproteobacteria bacterium]|nr:hypothetical protein [Deltaproteobacteria bacterium]
MEAVNEQDRTEMLAAKIVGDMLRNARLRRFALSVAENLIDTWARGGRVKQQIARPLRWMLTRGISPDGKKDMPAISSDLGRLLTAWSAGVNEDHRTDPSRHIAKRGRAIGAFIDGTDFGEVCEMIESSEECVVRTVDEFNRHLWKYPAKVGSILAALLAAMNTSIRALRELMRPVEKNVGPDLLADLVLSLVKGVNAKNAGDLANSAFELLRRLHTGSLLLGRSGRPLFQVYLTDFLKGMAAELDPVLLGKARTALAENRESIGSALADAYEANPDLALALISTLGAVMNASVKASSNRLKALGGIDMDSLSKAAGRAGTDLDTYEVAELANESFRLINRLHEASPDLFGAVARSVADSLDTGEIRRALEWIVPEMLNAFRPVIAEALPALVNGLCDMIGPAGGYESEGREEALVRLRTALHASGGER